MCARLEWSPSLGHNSATTTTQLMADIISPDILKSRELVHRAAMAFPERAYLRDSAQERQFDQTLRAIYISSSGNESVRADPDDEASHLAFECGSLTSGLRQLFFQDAMLDIREIEVLVVCSLLRVLGANVTFQNRFGGEETTPELVALHAVQHHLDLLPSYVRLSPELKRLICCVLKVHISMSDLIGAEVVPAHFAYVKDLQETDGIMPVLLASMAIDYLVENRRKVVSESEVDLVRLAWKNIQRHVLMSSCSRSVRSALLGGW